MVETSTERPAEGRARRSGDGREGEGEAGCYCRALVLFSSLPPRMQNQLALSKGRSGASGLVVKSGVAVLGYVRLYDDYTMKLSPHPHASLILGSGGK